MSLFSKLALTAGLAGAAVLVYAQKRSEKTGKDIGTVLSNLPEELKDTRKELEIRVREAADAGKKAAVEKEAEIDRQLEEQEAAGSGSHDSGNYPDYVA